MNDGPTPDARRADGLLLRRYREGGDEAAFAELRRRHERLVFSAALRETDDRALAEDATQGAFLLLTKKSFPEDASLAGWLFGAARLVAKNLVREESRRRLRERRAYREPETADEAWTDVRPHLNDALASLKPGDREAVLLRFAGERSLAEVGQVLGVGENAARMRVARALERMRLHLRRAGIGVSVILIASLLSTRIAEAAPSASPAFPHGVPRARGIGGRPGLAPPWVFGKGAVFALLGIGAAVAAGVAASAAFAAPRALSPQEADRLFRRSAGAWEGTLEFADDRTRVRTSTATTVEASREGNGLRLVARFPNYANVDTTTIRPLADGRFSLDTRGSHRLDGEYRLVRLRDGDPAFVGFSPSVRAEIRLRFRADSGRLTIQEEIDRGSGWRLRNRYDLRRAP